jgi:hypothetical protein
MPTSGNPARAVAVVEGRGGAEAVRDPLAEVTTTVRGIPQEIALGRREGLTLAEERHREVKRALGYALDWTELKIL